MNLSNLLNSYIKTLNCSSKDLAKASSLSTAAISRYRNGERVPNFESNQLNSLILGIVKLAEEKNIKNISYNDVLESFSKIYGNNAINSDIIREKLNKIIKDLNINVNKMAQTIAFDASYISRICSGQRKISNAENLIDSISRYISNFCTDSNSLEVISKFLDVNINDLTQDICYLKLKEWFFLPDNKDNTSIDKFLHKLDEFDLNKYIESIHFNELKVPNIPFQIINSKNYYGLNEMKNGELDFFKHTILSKKMEPIFMYNDMPINDMAEDVEFGKKWMFAIAMSLKKGLHLNIIHNLDRSFNEMMIGLESWIPIYMTGQVFPYYFKHPTNSIFNHTIYTSGACALFGQCINGFHSKAKYYLTSKKDELSFYKEYSNDLLRQANSLMNIYTEENEQDFQDFISSEKNKKENNIKKLNNENLKKTFKNIDFTINKDNWIVLTKKLSPKIHFVLYHPKLMSAIENFITPIIE